MTDLELAEQIERYLEIQRGDYFSVSYPRSKWQQIIAALRRVPERPPSGEMVMVPRWSPAKLTIEKIVALRTSREWGLNFDVIANNPHFRTQTSGRAICSCCDNAFTEIADLVPSYQVCRGCFDESTRMLAAAEASKEAK